jgi:hypothetical protein
MPASIAVVLKDYIYPLLYNIRSSTAWVLRGIRIISLSSLPSRVRKKCASTKGLDHPPTVLPTPGRLSRINARQASQSMQ